MRTFGALAILLLLAGCSTPAPTASVATTQAEIIQPDPNDAQLNAAPEESATETEAEPSQPEGSETEAADPAEPSEGAPASTAKPSATPKPTSTPKPTATPEPTVTAGPVFVSKAEVAKNNSRSSCWVIIDGSVYDLTKWIAQHPGGAGNILNLCGGDGTSSFTGMHGGESRPSNVLQNYFFAELER